MGFLKNDIMLALEDAYLDVFIVDEDFDYFTIEGDAADGYEIIEIVEDIVGHDAIIEINDLSASIYITIEV
tara:strand:- start:2149 stop:2361 length:213 start_codon:yes stop_codon:yes gene_type:complete